MNRRTPMRRSLWIAGLALAAPAAALAGERTVTLAVETMTCATCPAAVRIALKRVAGVRDVRVDFAGKIAVVTFDDAQTNAGQLAEASRLAGYPAAVTE